MTSSTSTTVLSVISKGILLLFITGYGYFTAWLPAAAVELIQRINGHGLSWMLVAMFVFNLFKLVLSLARR